MDNPSSIRKIVWLRGAFSLGFILLILLLNIVQVYPLFAGGYSNNLGSFEAAILADSRFISHFFPHLSWNPLWYLGYPFYLFYTPLLPAVISFWHFLLGSVGISSIYRVIVGLAYIGTPLTLYLLVKYLTRRELPALISGLSLSIPTVVSLVFPSVRTMVEEQGLAPWRLMILAVNGSGAHIIALFFLPLACLFFLHLLKYPAPKYYILSAIFIALVFLTHWVASVALVLMCLAILFSEVVLGDTFRKIKTSFICGLLTLGLLAFWFNPDFILRSLVYGENAQAWQELLHLLPLGFVIVPVTVTVLFLAFDRKPKLQILLLSLLWFVGFGLIIGAFEFYGKSIVPQPDRYVPEFSLSGSVLLGVGLTYVIIFLRRLQRIKLNLRIFRIASACLIITVIGLFIWLISLTLPNTQRLTAKHANIAEAYQYQAAQWLDEHTQGERVFAAGSTSAWLNVWTDVPQVYGWADLGATNPWWQEASQEIQEGKDARLAINWLKVLNVNYLAVTGNDFRYPEKFEGLLTLAASGKDWRIYQVPLTSPKLAQKGDKRTYEDLQLLASQRPSGEMVELYNNWFAQASDQKVSVNRLSNRQLAIEAVLGANDGVLIQETFHKGWQAKINSQPVKLESGPLGFIFVDPGDDWLTGPATIELSYHLPTSVYLGYIISIFTLLLIILYQFRSVKQWLEHYWAAKQPVGVLIAPSDKTYEGLSMADEDLATREVKDYYRRLSNHRWVEMTDNFQGLETYFHRNREALIRKSVQTYGQGKKYLDAGCGDGLVLRHLPPGSVGLDISPQAIVLAKKNAPHAALVVADIDEIPFPDNMFDSVVCTEVLEHLPKPRKAVSELHRVLKRGGVLIGTVPRVSPLWRLQFLGSSAPKTIPYHKEYKEGELRALLAGFEIIEVVSGLSNMAWVFVVKKE